MPELPNFSIFGYIGSILLISGFILIFSGIEIIKFPKFFIKPGKSTYIAGFCFVLFGFLFITPEIIKEWKDYFYQPTATLPLEATTNISQPTSQMQFISFPENPSGKISFFRSNLGYSFINQDGTNEITAAILDWGDYCPQISPEKNRVVFADLVYGEDTPYHNSYQYDIFVMNKDMTNKINLTKTATDENCSSWSPDGSKIVYSILYSSHSDLGVVNADGSDNKQLTYARSEKAIYLYYSISQQPWSSDNKYIIFHSNSDPEGDYELFIMDIEERDYIKITNNDYHDFYASWSPDGEKIVYVSSSDETAISQNGKIKIPQISLTTDIYVMNLVGENILIPTKITDGTSFNSYPVWSPDSNKIAFVSTRDGSRNIYIMNSDGSNVRKLTGDTQYKAMPYWIP